MGIPHKMFLKEALKCKLYDAQKDVCTLSDKLRTCHRCIFHTDKRSNLIESVISDILTCVQKMNDFGLFEELFPTHSDTFEEITERLIGSSIRLNYLLEGMSNDNRNEKAVQ